MAKLAKLNNVQVNTKKFEEEVNKIDSPALDFMFRNASQYFDYTKHKRMREEHGEAYPGDRKDPSWHFIPYNTGEAIRQLIAVRECLNMTRYRTDNKFEGPVRFLDAGCGMGNIMLLARAVKMDLGRGAGCIHGIELEKQEAQICRMLTQAEEPKGRAPWSTSNTLVYNGDIVTFKHYSRYEVVYYYCPIKFTPLQWLFEEKLEDALPLGGYIIANLKKNQSWSADDRFEHIKVHGAQVYGLILRKISNARRKITSLRSGDISYLPDEYQTLAKNHIKGLTHQSER